MDNGYEMCEYVDEADEPFVGGVDFIADDDIDEVPAIVDDTEVKPVNVSGLLTTLPKRRGRPPKSESEKVSVCMSCFLRVILMVSIL